MLPTRGLAFSVASSLALALLAAAPNVAHARKFVLIRHGEKPPVGNDLSDAGRARAECLKGFFGQGPLRPSYIFAQEPDPKADGLHEIRSLQTCQPLADHLGLPAVTSNIGTLSTLSRNVDISIDRDDVTKLTAAASNVSPANGTVLICWEHDTLPLLAQGFGVVAPPSWNSKDFDSVWVIDSVTKTMDVKWQSCGRSSSANALSLPEPLVLGAALLASVSALASR